MKRSCVIIPPPPPKPTTRPKNEEGIKPADEDFQGNKFNPNSTERYLIRVFSSNCLFWDDKNENWINKGCKVSECVFDVGFQRKGGGVRIFGALELRHFCSAELRTRSLSFTPSFLPC